MVTLKTKFCAVRLSLKDLLGKDYIDAVCAAHAYLSGENPRASKALASQKIDFYPKSFQQRLIELLPHVGKVCSRPLRLSAHGATTAAFQSNTKTTLAPVSGMGFFRLTEDGRLFLTSKSEHYHVPVGHSFPGYRLIDHAQRLGIPNATHNNTRGHITRLLEEELVRTAAGIPPGDRAALNRILASKSKLVLNRVLNLETGSLAAEAAIKMILARFYQPQADSPEPKYKGRIPVMVVIGDDDGKLQANYHGTTIVTQTMRGMWPDILSRFEKQGILLVRSVRPNHTEDLKAIFHEYEQDRYKIAGFFHEFVLMNYGAKRLTKQFARQAYALCKNHDVPTVADEIQSCAWYPDLYLFPEYGVKPTFVAIGKGFTGGEYAASRILFSAAMDTLPQFGALVTNGQEELASLAYLITMRWAQANGDVTSAVGEYYESELRTLAERYPRHISAIEGKHHLAGIFFHDLSIGKAFASRLNAIGLDISVQTYKADSPPSALTKIPITAGYEGIDAIITRMDEALKSI
ncbi:MAG: aminotransferase class III-fold pyridoxal phosphate-dependent enzyme [bacterium]